MSTTAKIDAALNEEKVNYSFLTLQALTALTREAHPEFCACFERILVHMRAQPFMRDEVARWDASGK